MAKSAVPYILILDITGGIYFTKIVKRTRIVKQVVGSGEQDDKEIMKLTYNIKEILYNST